MVDSIYHKRHYNVRKARGNAKTYKCVDCNKPAHDWTYIHNTCPDDINNYEPRCCSCHAIYDGYTDRRTISDEQIIKAKELREQGLTHRAIGSILNVGHQTVGRALREELVGQKNHTPRNPGRYS